MGWLSKVKALFESPPNVVRGTVAMRQREIADVLDAFRMTAGDDAFVILQKPGTDQFVQFAFDKISFDLDFPDKHLSDTETAAASRILEEMGGVRRSYDRKDPDYGGSWQIHSITANQASDITIRLLSEVFGMEPGTELEIVTG